MKKMEFENKAYVKPVMAVLEIKAEGVMLSVSDPLDAGENGSD